MKDCLTNGVRNFPYKVISLFKNLKPENAISLFCDPRGGSTWLAETLNTIAGSIIIDEPLHLRNIKNWKTWAFHGDSIYRKTKPGTKQKT